MALAWVEFLVGELRSHKLNSMAKNKKIELKIFFPTSKVMLKISQARLQQQVSWELPDVQARFGRGRWIRNQIANICWIIEKAKEFQKNIYFCFIDYMNEVMWITTNFGKLLKKRWEYQTTLPVRTGQGTMDWFKICTEYVNTVYCHPVCLTSV